MPQFETLWDHHPCNNGEKYPCKDKSGKPVFENQCAIRMGVCLERSGVSTKDFTGQRCWHGHNAGHIIRAEELANWLQFNKHQFGSLNIFKSDKAYREALGHIKLKRGIIFFRNFWGPGSQGDHIDLWNRLYTTRELQSIIGALIPSLSGYGRSQEVWFWEMS
jgi:hypothetical protein